MRVTIFSTGGKFRPDPFYVVTRSYSGRPFLCPLGTIYTYRSIHV